MMCINTAQSLSPVAGIFATLFAERWRGDKQCHGHERGGRGRWPGESPIELKRGLGVRDASARRSLLISVAAIARRASLPRTYRLADSNAHSTLCGSVANRGSTPTAALHHLAIGRLGCELRVGADRPAIPPRLYPNGCYRRRLHALCGAGIVIVPY